MYVAIAAGNRDTRPGATATNGSGLAIAFDGSLRFSDGNTVKSSPTGFSASTVSTEDLIVGLGVANGGDGSAVTSLSIGAVCASTSNTILCAPKTGGTLSAFAVFEADEISAGSAQYFEFLTNDVAIVATSIDPNNESDEEDFNGILWKVTASGPGAVPCARDRRASRLRDRDQLLFVLRANRWSGGRSEREGEVFTHAAGTTHLVQFGPVAVDVVTQHPAARPFNCVSFPGRTH